MTIAQQRRVLLYKEQAARRKTFAYLLGTPTEPRPESDLRRIAKGVAPRYIWNPDGVEKGVGAWDYVGLPKTWKADVPPRLYETDEEHDCEWQRDG